MKARREADKDPDALLSAWLKDAATWQAKLAEERRA
jgi:hypothetical protein